ncbi:MAG: hypothetical protein JNM94_12140 [Phycisphaerae bacterium]|nr:hypothetical protein [Phycisphaerae bacterium]
MPVPTDADYVLVSLTTGPASATLSPADRDRVFRGHMASNHRLFAAGQLLVAGPFLRPTDPNRRGMFVLDVADADAARAIVETDPGVAEGVFRAECCAVRGPRTLRMASALQRDALAALGAVHHDPESPPPNLRTYVYATAPSEDRLLALPLTRAILTLRFRTNETAVAILDAERVEEIMPHVNPTFAASITLDHWMSTTSLARLPRPAE